ncbi:hypothetical protein D3C79_815780 [compost metagenome]
MLFGTGREIVIAGGNFGGTAVDGIGPLTHTADGLDQFALHVFEAGSQHTHFIAAGHGDRLGQIAGGNHFDVLDHAVQRAHQNVVNAAPYQYDHRQHHDQHHDQRPDSETEGIVAVFHRGLVELVVLRQVGVVDLFKAVLIALRRLVKESVDLAFAQQLDQLGQRAVQNAVLLFEFFGRLRILARI